MALQAKSTKTEDLNQVTLTEEELAAAAATESRLQNLDDDGTPDPEDPNSQAGKKTASKSVTPENEGDSPATDEEVDDPTPAAEEKEIELPDNLYRAAIHAEWTHEEIKEFFESNPEKAMKTFEKIYHSTNKLSSEFSRLGRQPQTNVQPSGQPAQPAPVKLDWSKLESEYGKNDPLVELVRGLSDQVTQLSRSPVQPAAARQDVQPAPDPYLRQQIDVFFTDDSMKPYEDFYGKGKDTQDLTMKQQQNRWKMLNMADEIIGGAQLTGRQMDLDEAMERAHMVLTDSLRTEAVRKELVTKIKVKAHGITLKPRGRSVVSSTKSNSAEEIEQRVSDRLAKVFNS